jgi:uncharacterized protein (DUF58 family)
MNNKTQVLGLIIFSLLIISLITRNGDIAWMMLPFLAYLWIGIYQAPDPDKLMISANRTLNQTRTDETVVIDSNLTIQNNGVKTIHLWIEDSLRPGMKTIIGEISRRVSLLPGEVTELRYSFTAVRGDYSWESVRAVISDPLDLIETEILLPAGATIQVWPQIRKFKVIQFKPRSTLHSPGSIPAHLGGNGTDFWGVREYHPGDPLRSLDWRLTARHPHQFFTKEFEQEEIAEIGLILDARQSTDLQIGEESLFEHSVGAAASLAEMFLHQGHRVSLVVYGETMSNVFPGYSKVQLHRIMSCLSKAKVENEQHTSTALDFLPIHIFPVHSLVIIISSLTPADRTFFQRLRAYGYQALLISPDPVDFAYPTLAQDDINQLAIRAALLKRLLQVNSIAQLGIPVIDWQVNQPLFPLVRNAMTLSRGQRE